jgi:hypothetical protein
MITVTTPPTTNMLTVLATAARELAISDATAGLQELIGQASDACARYCGRAEGFGRATVVQTERDVNAACIVMERDINPAITSVVEEGTTLAAADYELDGSLLYRLTDDSRKPWDAAKVVITYAAGYVLLTDTPQDLERACIATLGAIYAGRGRDPRVRSEAADGVGSVSYLDPKAGAEALPVEAAALLGPYRKINL